MRILYVSTDLPGFRECLFEGQEMPHGLPSFNKVMMGLIEQGHEVNFVVLHKRKNLGELNIRAEWLKQDQIKKLVYTNIKMPFKILGYFRLISAVKQVLKQGDYDFVYAHGATTGLAAIPAKIYGVPFAQRIYGTFLMDRIRQKGKVRTAIKHMIEWWSFRSRKSFLLVTNDGSKGDLVQRTVCGNKVPPYEFYFWVNGIERVEDYPNEVLDKKRNELLPGPFIFYCARFDEWKRHDRVLNIVSELKKRGRIVNAYFAGPPKTLGIDYYNSIVKLAEDLGIKEQVVFMGNVDSETITIMNKLSLVSMSLYDVCNLTNVFHEMLQAGSVIISKDDGTLDGFIEHRKNGFLIRDDDMEAVAIIEELLDNPDMSLSIRREAKSTSDLKMKSWKDRIDEEIRLIQKHSKRNTR